MSGTNRRAHVGGTRHDVGRCARPSFRSLPIEERTPIVMTTDALAFTCSPKLCFSSYGMFETTYVISRTVAKPITYTKPITLTSTKWAGGSQRVLAGRGGGMARGQRRRCPVCGVRSTTGGAGCGGEDGGGLTVAWEAARVAVASTQSGVTGWSGGEGGGGEGGGCGDDARRRARPSRRRGRRRRR